MSESPKQIQEQPENGKIEDYLAVLEEHRRTCEREGNFVEADLAKNRIEELKVQEAQRQMESLLLKQQKDRLGIEEAHTKEYEQFQEAWNQQMQHSDEDASKVLGQLEEKHTKELEENRVVLEQKIPLNFKPSSELLNLKRIQDQLAR